MPRRPRIHLDNGSLHIVERGHNREPCFFGEEDYQAYLHWLGDPTTHAHMLITPERSDAGPRAIIALGQTFRAIHKDHLPPDRHLRDSRYKSYLIRAETYLLACQRYVELDRVRAAMVDDPAHYRWTSYRHNALGQASRI